MDRLNTEIDSTVDQMTLDFNAYVAYIIDSMTKQQSNINAEMEYAKRAAAAHGRYVDSQIIVKFASAATSFQHVGADVNFTYADILAMYESYLTAEGLVDQGNWIISPAQNTAILNLSQFQSNQAYGEMVIRDGYVRQMVGMPVMIHNGLASKQAFLVSKEGMAIGFQKAPSMGEQPANEFGVGATRVAVDQLFGIKAMQTGLKGAAAGKSPLILGLND